jgi:hypothetical protein
MHDGRPIWDPPAALKHGRQRLRSLKVQLDEMEAEQFEREYGGDDGIDLGIREYVKLLRLNGIETYESCEGGPGHSYPRPTVAFHGGPYAGWQALSVCLTYGLPVFELRRVWTVQDRNEPTGPHWEITFRRKAC